MRLVWAVVRLREEPQLVLEIQEEGKPYTSLTMPISPIQIASIIEQGAKVLMELSKR